MKNKTILPEEKFIKKILRKLNPESSKHLLTRREAQSEARKIIEQIPYRAAIYFREKRHITSFPTEMILLDSLAYRDDLIVSESDVFNMKSEEKYKAFKKDSVCFFLCRYLAQMGLTTRLVCGRIDIIFDSGWKYQ